MPDTTGQVYPTSDTTEQFLLPSRQTQQDNFCFSKDTTEWFNLTRDTTERSNLTLDTIGLVLSHTTHSRRVTPHARCNRKMIPHSTTLPHAHSVASSDHVSELLLIAAPGDQLVADRLVALPPRLGRVIDDHVLIGWGSLAVGERTKRFIG